MRLVSWNVNGVRASAPKGLKKFIEEDSFDILCLQEIRSSQIECPLDLSPFHVIWNPADKKGYAGTAILAKHKPLNFTVGLPSVPDNNEGRVITCEYPDFYLVNVYTPNAQRELTRLTYRKDIWDPSFLAYLKNLEIKKPVIFCGDLNVAHMEIDLANPKSNKKNAGFTIEERTGFTNIINAGFIDTFREFEKGPGHYTWWSQRFQARARNIGWRIDVFGISSSLKPRLAAAGILKNIMGSDHCPVYMELRP